MYAVTMTRKGETHPRFACYDAKLLYWGTEASDNERIVAYKERERAEKLARHMNGTVVVWPSRPLTGTLAEICEPAVIGQDRKDW